MEQIKQIVLEEIDRSIGCARWWGKDDAYDSLSELKQRVEYRLRGLEQTQPKHRIHVWENGAYKEIL
jgi:hypothetical protein